MSGDVKIMVIDDDRDCAEALGETLADGGFSAHVAKDCAEAISIMGQHDDIGVSVIDLHLPEMNGLSLLASLRQAAGARGASLQALLISGDAGIGDLDTAMRLGVSAFLPKPVNRVALLNGITDAVARYRDHERDRKTRHGLVDRFRALEEGLAAAAKDMAGMVAMSLASTEMQEREQPPEDMQRAWDGVNCSRLLREALLMDQLFERREIDNIDWRVLLALYEATLAGGDTSATNIALACGASATAGLRHIAGLEERGLLKRTSDPNDARRSQLEMSDEAQILCRDAMASIMALRSGI